MTPSGARRLSSGGDGADRSSVARAGKDERGAAATEFALVMPLLVFVLVVLVEVGSLLIQYQQLVGAVREGARFGSLTQSTASEIQSVTRSAVSSGGFSAGPTVTVSAWPSGEAGWSSRSGGDRPCNQVAIGNSRVRVTVTATSTPRAPLLSALAIPMSAEGIFRCE